MVKKTDKLVLKWNLDYIFYALLLAIKLLSLLLLFVISEIV